MEKLQKKKWLFLICAVIFLAIWIALGISSRNSKPEAVVQKFFKAYMKQDVNASGYELIVGDVVYGKGEEANTAEVKCAIIQKGVLSGVDFNTLSLVKAGNKWHIDE